MAKIQPNLMLEAFNTEKSPDKSLDRSDGSQLAAGALIVKTKTFLEDVSVEGLKHVIRPRLWFMRLIWLALVLFGLGFMLYQFHDRITTYLELPTNVNIDVNIDKNVPFPTITICNENVVSKTKVAYDTNLSAAIQMVYPLYRQISPNETELSHLVYNTTISNKNWRDTLDNISSITAIDEFIIFDYSYYNQVHLSTSDFTYVRTDLGRCIQLNGDGNITATRSGVSAGLSLLIYANQDDYFGFNSGGAGLRVLLHQSSDIPQMRDFSIAVSTGFTNKIAMMYKQIQRLSAPYSDCNGTEGYSYYNCISACKVNYIIEKCGCQFYYGTVPDVPVCDPFMYWTCAVAIEWIALVFISDLGATCSCPDQCNENIYEYSLSSQHISKATATYFANKLCASGNTSCQTAKYNSIINDYLELQVYFSEMHVEKVTTVPGYTLLALLSDIGGAMGLLLGSTLLTAIEFGDFAIVLLLDYLKLKFGKKKAKRITSQESKETKDKESQFSFD